MDCLFCGEEIEDGDEIADAQHGEAVIREGEEEWRGQVKYGSVIKTVHADCFEKAQDNFNEVIE